MVDLLEVSSSGELKINLHQGQARALRSTKRFIGVVAGTQSGKTSFTPVWLWNEIRQKGPGDYGFITPTFTLMEVKALPEFRRLFEDTLALGTYTASPVRKFTFSASGLRRTFGYDTGPVTIFFGYAENPDSLESATYKGAVLDEAGQRSFKRESWEAIQRRLAIHLGRVLITTTPYSNFGWLVDEIINKAKAGDPSVDLITFSSLMNPMFPREEFQRAMRTLPWWKFSMFYLGQIERPAGMIYDVFSDAHRVPRFTIPQDWKRYIGLDFGGVNTCAVFLAESPEKKLYIYRVYHAGGRTAAEHVKALLEGEPKIAACVGGAKSEGQWRDEFKAAGLSVREPDQPSVEVGIDRVYGALKTNVLSCFSDLPDLITEFDSYSRVLDSQGQPTEEIQDKSKFHRLDALRYILGWLNRKHTKMQTGQVDLYGAPMHAQRTHQRTAAEIEALLEA